MFTEKQQIQLIQSNCALPTTGGVVVDEDLESELLIPRRPKWNKTTTAEELKELENESYLKWRRKLAVLQERDDIVLTPFEKNLEFWRQLWRVVERSDVLIQILDARNPLLFFSEDLDKYIKEVDEKKLCVILVNKSDYLTEDQRKCWLEYFESTDKKCVFFSALEQQPKEDDDQNDDDVETELQSLSLEQCQCNLLNYKQLISYFKSLRSKLSIEEDRSITVGFIGYPNVGKSSTINALLRVKKVSVSAMPGKTKHFQTIALDDEITICDCPGLVFPNIVSSKAEMIINGILPIDQMKDAMLPIAVITEKIPAYVFESLYGIMLIKSDEDDHYDPGRKVSALELLTTYGYSRGFMTQRGLPDSSRAARYILKDFVIGKLLFCRAPPGTDQQAYNVFPEYNRLERNMTDRKLERIYEANDLKAKNFDREFFCKTSTTVHTKGRRAIPTNKGETVAADGKPWKKHNNRNKREKLRRVYSHLDQ